VPVGVLASLLAARMRCAGLRRLAVAAALGLATALAVVSAAVTAVTAESTLTTAVAGLMPGERSVVVSSYGLPTPQRVDELDALVTSRLPRLGSGPLRRQLVHREISDSHGNGVVVAATDDLAGAVRLVSGRLPRSCTPVRCEVVLLLPDRLAPGAAARQPPAVDPALGLVVVGTVQRADPLLLSGTFAPSTPSPVLLGDGVRQVGALAMLQPFARTLGWVAPLDLARVKSLGVDSWADTAVAVADEFGRRAPDELTLTAPTNLLRDQHERALTSTQRFGLLGATGSVLLLGAAVVGGAALRRDHEAFTGALRRRGAAPRLLRALLAGEVLGAAVAGLAAGCLLGAAGAAVVAARGGLPVLATAGAAVLAALPGAAVLTLVAGVLLAVTVALPAARDGAAARAVWHAVEAAALVCVAVAAVLAARGGVTAGSADADSGSGGTSDPLLLTLPVLVLAAAALGLARLWLPVVRGGERLVPRRSVAARLGLAAVTGRPLRPAATAALLTAAVATSVFAGAYRATLDRGATDQAAFAVPLDARVQTGPSLVRPYDAAAPSTLASTLPGVTARPVLRVTATRRVASDRGAAVQFVGLPPATLPEMAAWADTTGGPDPARVAEALRVGPLPQGTPLPAGRRLRIATPGPAVTLAVTATVRASDGREQNVELRVVPATRRAPAGLEGDLSALDRAGVPAPQPRLVALTLRLPTDQETRRVHGIGEDTSDRPLPTGRLALGAVTVDGTPVASPWRGWTGSGATAGSGGRALTADYRLSTGAAVLTARSGGPGDEGSPVPVAVDPATAAAARDGLVDLALSGAAVTARVVAVLPRFPTVTGSFAVVDLGALERLVDVSTPGVAEPGELWLAGPGLGRLADPPFTQLTVQLRAPLEASLRADPVARGAADLLGWAAAATLLAGAAALILLVAAERYDDAAAEYAWEADGVPPSTLRAALWWRALAVAVPAVPAGILGGVVLATVTARLVAVTATATAARPPLVAGAGLLPGSLLALAVLAVALAAAAGLAATSLREPLPRRRTGVAE
jgi:hypothetical protein